MMNDRTKKVRAIMRKYWRRDYRGFPKWDPMIKEVTEYMESVEFNIVKLNAFRKGKNVHFPRR